MRSAKDVKDGAAVLEEKRKTAVQIPVVKEDVQEGWCDRRRH